jgi:CheY-like chemotaxis protein
MSGTRFAEASDMLQPSCPVLVVLKDDSFRKALIASLDLKHFAVTVAVDGDETVELLRNKQSTFKLILLGIDLQNRKGMHSVQYLREHRDGTCGVILIGDPTPELRTFAPWADETLMKPVDPTTSRREQGRTAVAKGIVNSCHPWMARVTTLAQFVSGPRSIGVRTRPTRVKFRSTRDSFWPIHVSSSPIHGSPG